MGATSCHKNHLLTVDGEYERNLKVIVEKIAVTLIEGL